MPRVGRNGIEFEIGFHIKLRAHVTSEMCSFHFETNKKKNKRSKDEIVGISTMSIIRSGIKEHNTLLEQANNNCYL